MTRKTGPARMTTVATFPADSFLENLAVRSDGSILVTVLNRKQLWHLPAPAEDRVVTPTLVHTFDNLPLGIVETEADVFYVGTARQPALERLDLRNWSPGAVVQSMRVLSFGDTTALNGACLIAPGVLLLADCLDGCIRRVDLADNGFEAKSSVWLRHPTMASEPGNGLVSALGPQPGINGIRHACAGNAVYYTSTAQGLFMRVPVDATTLAPAGPPQTVASGIEADDFCIDENDSVAYLTTHTDNTIVCVSTDPAMKSSIRAVVAGDLLVGPSSAVWASEPASYGRVAYVTTDGGHTAVTYGRQGSDGHIRPARVLRVEFNPSPAS